MTKEPSFYVVFYMGDDYYAQWMLDIVAATKEAAELYVAYAVLAGRRLDQFEIVVGAFNETTGTWISPDEFRQ